MFKLFLELQYHDKPDLNSIFPESVHDASALHVCSFILSILHQGVFSVSAFIVSVIYLSRFKECSHISLHAVTWRPLFLVSLLLADKMWEDKPVRNSSLAKLFPVLSTDELNMLENRFLMQVKFGITVTPDLFCAFCEKLLTEDVQSVILKGVTDSEYAQTLAQDAAQAPVVIPKPSAESSDGARRSLASRKRDEGKAGPHSGGTVRPLPARNGRSPSNGNRVNGPPATNSRSSIRLVDTQGRSFSAGPSPTRGRSETRAPGNTAPAPAGQKPAVGSTLNSRTSTPQPGRGAVSRVRGDAQSRPSQMSSAAELGRGGYSRQPPTRFSVPASRASPRPAGRAPQRPDVDRNGRVGTQVQARSASPVGQSPPAPGIRTPVGPGVVGSRISLRGGGVSPVASPAQTSQRISPGPRTSSAGRMVQNPTQPGWASPTGGPPRARAGSPVLRGAYQQASVSVAAPARQQHGRPVQGARPASPVVAKGPRAGSPVLGGGIRNAHPGARSCAPAYILGQSPTVMRSSVGRR